MSPRIEILCFDGCPHAKDAAETARRVATPLAPGTAVETVPVRTDDEARSLRVPGSPTIRVDGRDVEDPTLPSSAPRPFGS